MKYTLTLNYGTQPVTFDHLDALHLLESLTTHLRQAEHDGVARSWSIASVEPSPEEWLAANGAGFLWSRDWSIGSHIKEFGKGVYVAEPETCEQVTLVNGRGIQLAHLGCIDNADDSYRRHVERELLRGAMAQQ